MTTDVAKCPVPWIDPDDLIRADHPGMQLTAAEAREVETSLNDALAEHVAHLLTDMRDRIVMVCGGVSVERRRLGVSGAGAVTWSLTLTGGAHSLLAYE
nr:hypothetical protein OG781_44285 [Streptomyces sp. NBC_00830]